MCSVVKGEGAKKNKNKQKQKKSQGNCRPQRSRQTATSHHELLQGSSSKAQERKSGLCVCGESCFGITKSQNAPRDLLLLARSILTSAAISVLCVGYVWPTDHRFGQSQANLTWSPTHFRSQSAPCLFTPGLFTPGLFTPGLFIPSLFTLAKEEGPKGSRSGTIQAKAFLTPHS